MEKKEVIVDTCFLQKISSEGEYPENIEKVLEELEFTPVVHPYIAEHELKLHSCFERMMADQCIRVIPYREFLDSEYAEKSYEAYFEMLYEDLRKFLDTANSFKRIPKLQLYEGQTIYNTHKRESSMGDVHMILMAAYMKLPIVLTEDSDIELLRDIASRRMSLGDFSLQIYNGLDLVNQIAQKERSSFTKKELEMLLNQMHERGYRSKMTQIWNESHHIE